jgi:tetratricopeptide (TPR) repeat protein
MIMHYRKSILLMALLLTVQPVLAESDESLVKKAVDAGRLQEADNLYKQMVAKNPKQSDYHLRYAGFLRNIGQNEAAIREYQRALEIAPAQPEAMVALSQIALQILDLESAIRFSQAALKINPNSREAGLVYASACMQSGQTAQADTEIALLLSQNKDCDVSYLAYQMKARKGDFVQARKHLQDAVAGRPEETGWMLQLCKLLESSGDYHASRQYLQSALDRKNDTVEARVALARNLEVFENDYDGAIAEYTRVLAIDPDQPQAKTGRERCLAKKNDIALRFKLSLQSMFAHH